MVTSITDRIPTVRTLEQLHYFDTFMRANDIKFWYVTQTRESNTAISQRMPTGVSMLMDPHRTTWAFPAPDQVLRLRQQDLPASWWESGQELGWDETRDREMLQRYLAEARREEILVKHVEIKKRECERKRETFDRRQDVLAHVRARTFSL